MRRALLRLLAGLAVLLAGANAGAAPLRIAVSVGPVSLPLYVAQARGYFLREGIEVELHDGASGQACLQRLAHGEADLATGAEFLVTLSGLRGADVVILATLSSSTRHIKLVARRDAGIRTAADLSGRRIATVPGTSAQYFLDNWLVYHGIEPAGVTALGLAPEQLVTALLRREADAIAIWEPLATQAVQALGAEALLLPSPRVYTQHFELVASRGVVAQRTPELQALMRALDRARRYIAEHPGQAVRLLDARLKGEPGTVGIGELDYGPRLEQSLIATMDGQARWARARGLLPARDAGTLLRFIDPSVLRSVTPEAVQLAP